MSKHHRRFPLFVLALIALLSVSACKKDKKKTEDGPGKAVVEGPAVHTLTLDDDIVMVGGVKNVEEFLRTVTDVGQRIHPAMPDLHELINAEMMVRVFVKKLDLTKPIHFAVIQKKGAMFPDAFAVAYPRGPVADLPMMTDVGGFAVIAQDESAFKGREALVKALGESSLAHDLEFSLNISGLAKANGISGQVLIDQMLRTNPDLPPTFMTAYGELLDVLIRDTQGFRVGVDVDNDAALLTFAHDAKPGSSLATFYTKALTADLARLKELPKGSSAAGVWGFGAETTKPLMNALMASLVPDNKADLSGFMDMMKVGVFAFHPAVGGDGGALSMLYPLVGDMAKARETLMAWADIGKAMNTGVKMDVRRDAYQAEGNPVDVVNNEMPKPAHDPVPQVTAFFSKTSNHYLWLKDRAVIVMGKDDTKARAEVGAWAKGGRGGFELPTGALSGGVTDPSFIAWFTPLGVLKAFGIEGVEPSPGFAMTGVGREGVGTLVVRLPVVSVKKIVDSAGALSKLSELLVPTY